MVSELVLATAVMLGVYYDLKERRIPNWVTLPSLGAGLALQTFYSGTSGLIIALGGAAAGAALLALPYILGWVGGGDLKLLAAVGALMGAPFAFWTLLFATIVGGLMVLGWLAMMGSLASSVSHIVLFWRRRPGAMPAALAAHVSFGPALALGALIAKLWQ